MSKSMSIAAATMISLTVTVTPALAAGEPREQTGDPGSPPAGSAGVDTRSPDQDSVSPDSYGGTGHGGDPADDIGTMSRSAGRPTSGATDDRGAARVTGEATRVPPSAVPAFRSSPVNNTVDGSPGP